ncbi:MAG TPA: glutaredoxin family protein [Terriglobia bacterium]|nr:glutaredoxin family protein [Terriglobia bacterium]
MGTRKIRIYTRSWCEDSREVKKFLLERNLPFEEIDIERSPQACEFVLRTNEGKERTPTLEADGRDFHCSPFDEQKLIRELHLEK